CRRELARVRRLRAAVQQRIGHDGHDGPRGRCLAALLVLLEQRRPGPASSRALRLGRSLLHRPRATRRRDDAVRRVVLVTCLVLSVLAVACGGGGGGSSQSGWSAADRATFRDHNY